MKHQHEDGDLLIDALEAIWRRETARILLWIAVATCFGIGTVSSVIYVNRDQMYRTNSAIYQLEQEITRNRSRIWLLQAQLKRAQK